MTKSYPSTRITVGDIPEVRDFRASFVYNFFTPDEQEQYAKNVSTEARVVPSNSSAEGRVDRVSRNVPRLVRFDFRSIMADDNGPNEFVKRQDNSGRGTPRSIIDAIRRGTIQGEEDFSNNRFVGLNFQDDNIDGKLKSVVSGSVAKRATAHNRLKRQQIEEQRQSVIDNITDQHSLMDAARALVDQTSRGVSDNLVVNALDNIESLKLTFIDDEGQRALQDQAFKRVSDVSMKAQFSNKVVGAVVRQVVDDPMSPFSDEFAPLLQDAEGAQAAAKAADDPGTIQRDDFDAFFDAIGVSPIDSEDITSSTRFMGYIIEKHELRAGQRPIRRASIVLEDPNVAVAEDTEVTYGSMYVYTIRSVAELTIKCVVDDSDDIVMATGVVTSRKSRRSLVNCVENVPPPPPVDLNAFWDYQRNDLMMMWSFPTNAQRDIKKFQVFRRKTIDEPFQLIREFDFDDSNVRTPNPETPRADLVQMLPDATTIFRDKEFTKESSFIYAVCAVDAHQFTSNYSLQMRVSFDRSTNSVMKELVSVSGAPKSYPNMVLNQDLFVDTIKTSGKRRCRIFFDPELLELYDAEGNDLKLLVRQNIDGGKYRLQIINTDVLKQEVVDVSIDDLRLPSV